MPCWDRAVPSSSSCWAYRRRRQDSQRVRTRRTHLRALHRRQGAGADLRLPADPADTGCRSARDRHGRAAAGRDFPRQRLGQGQCGALLPRRRPVRGGAPGRPVLRCNEPARPDDAALGAGATRARRHADRARRAQPRSADDPRQGHRRLGHQGEHRRDQARRYRRKHDPRSRARPKPSACAGPRSFTPRASTRPQ